MRSAICALAGLMAWSSNAFAGSTSACGTTASPHPDFDDEAWGCNAVCAEAGNSWTCNVGPLMCDAEAWMIHNPDFASTTDLVAWGRCIGGGDEFCCQWEEGGSNVTKAKLVGSANADILSLTYVDDNVLSWDGANIEGVVEAGDGADQIFGSNTDAATYIDKLYGEAGNDECDGGEGDDLINGGSGDDTLNGGGGDDTVDGQDGNDHVTGGEGDDTLLGGANDDILCDTSGDLVCATDGAHVFLGGDGADKLWYDEDVCGFLRLNAGASSGGNGGDECGDNADFAANQLPASCQLIMANPGC